MSDTTQKITEHFRQQDEARGTALAEVLCSAYKDATGRYPSDSVREAIYEAVKA